MGPMGLPQCVLDESTLLWEPFMFCSGEKREVKGNYCLLLTQFLKQDSQSRN